jgi:hypothetical protein
MEQSMHNGDFWVCLAANDIYWKFIDPRYYGKFTSFEDRAELHGLFKKKTEQAAERELDKYWTVDQILAS